MRAYTLTHLEDHELVSNLKSLLARSHGITAAILAHIAEVEARRIHLGAGYPSMHAYCVHELGLSDDAANKRIHAARAARQHPELFSAVSDGRLHLTAVNLLASYLTTVNADDLIAAATRRTRREIEELLAARFPKTEFLPLVEMIRGSANAGVSGRTDELVPPQTGASLSATTSPTELAPERVNLTTPTVPAAVARVDIPRSAVKPHAMDRFALHLMLERATYEKLRRAQEYLSHAIPDGDVARVFDRALDLLLAALEKQKFAATNRPRPASKRESKNPRHIPAHVKREVWRRDQGQCSFVSESGQQCSARTHLEFDHEEPVARGGESKVSNLRLRCRAHNQYEAEQIFGAQFMSDKRHAARLPTIARAAEPNP
jgi:hypothetical protein